MVNCCLGSNHIIFCLVSNIESNEFRRVSANKENSRRYTAKYKISTSTTSLFKKRMMNQCSIVGFCWRKFHKYTSKFYSPRLSLFRYGRCREISPLYITDGMNPNCESWSTVWLNSFCHTIRKSKDYVYGIWVYKALGIWKGYYRVKKSLVSYVKPWTEARNDKCMKYHSKLTYQLSFWNVSRKVDYHAGGKWFIHGPKRRKENQLLSLKHAYWLSLV